MFRIIIIFCLLLQQAAANTISADGNLTINTSTQIITTESNVSIAFDGSIMKADSVQIFYNNLNRIAENIKAENYENFKRIEAHGNVSVQYAQGGLMLADEYIHDIPKNIMVLRSIGKPTTYTDENIKISSTERFEFLYKQNIAAARGSPRVEVKEVGASGINMVQYVMTQKLLSLKLDENKAAKEVEAFDNVRITTADGSLISGDYAYINLLTKEMTVDDNIRLKRGSSTLVGCQIQVNLAKGTLVLIPCDSQEKFETTIALP